MDNFEGKKAIVTGAGNGIGRCIAKALSIKGAIVHGISRTEADLITLKQEISEIHIHCADVTDWQKMRELLQSIGPVDYLVNNAGPPLVKPFLETTKEELLGTFAVNTEAVFNISQVVARGMVDRGKGGSIVNISADLVIKQNPKWTAFTMSKAASDMLTKCMALELGKHQIRVNSVLPGAVRTPRTVELFESDLDRWAKEASLGKMSEMDDIMHAVLFLLSDKANMITGTWLTVNGGFN